MNDLRKIPLLDKIRDLTQKVNDLLHCDFHNIEINGDVITLKVLNVQQIKDEFFTKSENKNVLKILRKSNRQHLVANTEFAFHKFGFYFIVKNMDIGSKGLWEIASENNTKHYE